MEKFWNFIQDDASGERILRLEGPIDEDNLWGDEITPDAFRDELNAEDGDVTVWLNSPGGNVFAANQIYNMLKEHKGSITVKIDAIAASAASVVAMAGDRVLMSPVSMLMIHDPMTMAMGNTKDMEAAIKTLNEVKESIINAYQKKTGLSRNKISQLMSDETWMNARKAVDLGFADEILYGKEADKKDDKKEEEDSVTLEAAWQPYHAKLMGQSIWAWLNGRASEKPSESCEGNAEAPDESKNMESSEGEVKDAAPAEDKPQEAEPSAENPDGGGDSPGETEAGKSSGGIPDKEESPNEDNPSGDDPKEKLNNELPEKPVIGMDGKTKDGAMPYEILKRELQLLR